MDNLAEGLASVFRYTAKAVAVADAFDEAAYQNEASVPYSDDYEDEGACHSSALQRVGAFATDYKEKDTHLPRLAVSDCLVGTTCRYNRGHCYSAYLVETLSPLSTQIPVCPEMSIGLGVPREVVRIVQAAAYKAPDNIDDVAKEVFQDEARRSLDAADIEDLLQAIPCPSDEIRLITRDTHVDLTERMWRTGLMVMKRLKEQQIDGYVLKGKSPSCGVRVPWYAAMDERGGSSSGPGLWVKLFQENWPDLPIIDEGRLSNPEFREQFLISVFAHARFRNIDRSVNALSTFHAEHKYLLMAHSPDAVTKCGRIVAEGAKSTEQLDSVFSRYQALFFCAFNIPPTPGRWINALNHMFGYFKRHLTPEEKQEFQLTVEEYHAGFVPLLLPIRLLLHHAKVHRVSYIGAQAVLSPTPTELKANAYLNADVKSTPMKKTREKK